MLLTNQKVADDFAEFVADLKGGKGLFGRLVRDEQWAAQGDRIFANLVTVTDKIASGEGTVGRLIMDDTVIRKLERLVGQFSRTLEDAREAAPIGTFFQVFGAFN
jgi:phospholipid/cholesterol/gamma-HCH transport system substrate-binding protein